MTITYPRDMLLCTQWQGPEFVLEYAYTRALAGGGLPQVAEVAPALWVGKWRTTQMGRDNISNWRAWLRSLRGGLRTFKAVPPFYRWPRLHPRGFAGMLYSGSPWTGTGNLSNIAALRDQITINTIPNGLVMAPGDYVSIVVGARQHLHQVIEGGTSSGNLVTLTVEPTIRPGAVTGVTVLFEYPYCEMALRGTPNEPQDNRILGQFSFDGVQVAR